MTWKIEFDDRARRELRKLDKTVQDKILNYFRKRVMPSNDPRSLGKSLVADKKGLWRYRVGDYRIICRIEDNKLVILVLAVGHRKEIYD